MATPIRIITTNTTYICQRRTSERRFFLKPSKQANAIIQYCLAWASKKHGVLIHEYLFQFNHYHMVLTDVEGNLPDFFRDFHAIVSRAIGCLHKQPWPIWGKESYNACKLLSKEAAIDAITYTLNNPVKDGLVKSYSKWSGLNSAHMKYGETFSVRKPNIFFSDKLPDVIDFKLTQAPDLSAVSREEIQKAVKSEETRLREALLAKKVFIPGMKRLMKQRITDAPASPRKLSRLKPTVKAKNRQLMMKALQEKKELINAYRRALKKFQEQTDKPLFPYGTYGLVRLGLVTTAM